MVPDQLEKKCNLVADGAEDLIPLLDELVKINGQWDLVYDGVCTKIYQNENYYLVNQNNFRSLWKKK